MIVSVTFSGLVTSWLLVASADTVTSLSDSFSKSSIAAIVTVPVLVVSPAATVSTVFALNAKSSATAPSPGVAEIVTIVAALDA